MAIFVAIAAAAMALGMAIVALIAAGIAEVEELELAAHQVVSGGPAFGLGIATVVANYHRSLDSRGESSMKGTPITRGTLSAAKWPLLFIPSKIT